MVDGTIEQNAIFHIMAYAVADGHCAPYTALTSIECSDAGGVWTAAAEPPAVSACRPDACGVCGGPDRVVPAPDTPAPEKCDCAGHVLDSNGICGGFGDDVCGTYGGPGIAPGKCDCAGNVQDCKGVCGGSAKIDACGICDPPVPCVIGGADADGSDDDDDDGGGGAGTFIGGVVVGALLAVALMKTMGGKQPAAGGGPDSEGIYGAKGVGAMYR